MAEAVAASSQLLSNLFKAAKTAETFYAGFHHASEEIKVLRAQCRQVALRLECLQVTAKILRNVDPLSFRLPQLLEECVELLWKDLIALQRKCPNVSQLDKKKQFAWAWKNRELMRKMVKQLELAEGNLSTILQALQFELAVKHQNTLQHVRLAVTEVSVQTTPDNNISPPNNIGARVTVFSPHRPPWHWLLEQFGCSISVLSYLSLGNLITSLYLLYRLPLVGKILQFQITTRRLREHALGWNLLGGHIVLKNRVSKNSDFFLACWNGRIEEVRQHLSKRNGGVHDVTGDGDTALAQAVRGENLEVVKLLLDAGADTNVIDRQQRSILQFSFRTQSTSISRLLISNNADIDHINAAGTTLAMIASGPGIHSIEHLNMLQAQSASFTSVDAQGKTALHYAAQFSSAVEVSILLRNGAPAMIADQAGRTALLEAARSCNQGAVQAILAGSATEARNLARQEDFAGWNALHWAVRGNGIVGRDLMVVKAILCLLLESGADPEAFGSYQRGWTPAMLQDKAFTPMQLAQAMGEDMFEIWKEVWSDFVDGENDTFFDVEIL